MKNDESRENLTNRPNGHVHPNGWVVSYVCVTHRLEEVYHEFRGLAIASGEKHRANASDRAHESIVAFVL